MRKEQVKMSLKNTKTWSRVLVPVLLLCCVSYYYSHFFLQSSEGAFSKALCDSWNISQKWERLNFNVSRNAQLFLKLEDFFWRRYLSTLALPYGVKGSELFLVKALAAMASYDMPERIKHLPCKTCMVVGNGFAIKNTSLGSAINKYDIVIRLNDAPVRGYEADVGNKTTMRLFYPESASYNPSIHNDPDTLMVLVPFKQQDVRWLKEILYNEKRIRKGFWKPPPEIWLGKTSHIRILDPYFLQQTASRMLRLPLNTPPKTNQPRCTLVLSFTSGRKPLQKHPPNPDQAAWQRAAATAAAVPGGMVMGGNHERKRTLGKGWRESLLSGGEGGSHSPGAVD
ncbi:CMP-N-acetylneuraminate-beta-galactosamide-alpha-2,3-sialyltransferase 4-like isoform X3 [Salvelinus alpinus]|uniref:CMP-N-acetylneuraminate-beta-galactosamide- alpha-2,3-sialyltransferase 4-like isoform X3 n=1 Tax=Salvelinus alpinus TaxID=8036 RepID=UPI0039FCB7F3